MTVAKHKQAVHGDTAGFDPNHGPEIMIGTGKEVQLALDNAPEARVVAVRMQTQSTEQAAAAESVFTRVAEYLPQLIEKRQQETIQKFVAPIFPGRERFSAGSQR